VVVKLAKNIGTVTHFFDKISVAIIKLDAPLKVGDEIAIKGVTTDEKVAVDSMQVDHKDIDHAEKGQEVGIKVAGRVREGDKASIAEANAA